MKRILHLSDLHITSAMPEPQENPIITKLIKKIQISFKKVHILIFTGDLIDSFAISERIKRFPENMREQKWNEEAEKAFALGEKYLTFIKNELNISDDKIILCVGNHDVNRNCNEKESISCHKSDVVTYKRRFDAYRTFSDGFLPFKDSFKTHFRSIESFNFLVVNSNWNNDNKARLCINCSEVSKVITDNISELQKDKNRNIFVSHSPISDFCEEARYGYPENEYAPIKDKINTYFNVLLAGDKHTKTFDSQELIVGAPIDSSKFSYGIYEFSNNTYCLKHITFDGSEWEIETDSNSIQEIYNASKNFLKQSGIEVLYKINSVDDNTIISQKYKGSEQQWDYFNQLFLAYTTLKKTEIGTSGTKHSIDDNLIFAIFNIIQNSKGIYPLVLRGMPKSGKSLFLTLLYLYLLEMYAKNRLEYIPVYFNLDSIVPSLDSKGWKYIETCINNFFECSKQLSNKYGKPVCFILDGFSKCKYYDTCIEDYIQVKIESNYKFTNDSNKFVVCLDTDEDLHLTNTDFDKAIEADYVLYFNPITIKKTYPKSNLERFIDAFTNLYSIATKETVIKNINNLNLHSIDLHTLIKFKNYFAANNNANCCITELYMADAMKIFGKQNIDNASLACYKLYYENKTYEKIISDGCKLSHSSFETIKKQKTLAMYLIARCYVTSIEKFNYNKKPFKINTILNECFNCEISTFVKGLILKNSLSEKLKVFSEKCYSELNFRGKAMITYFSGRTCTDNKKLSSTLETQLQQIKRRRPKDKEDGFFKEVAQRSIFISRISGLTDYEKYEEEYIFNLITNREMRYVNREFYLLYYGDRKSNELTFNYIDTLYEGFDFYNVFHILVTKLEEWKENPTKSKLLRLEIFTLCDLIQQRIDNNIAISRNNRAATKDFVDSFFYDCRLLDKAKNVLEVVISIINAYLSFDSSKNLFTSYLQAKGEEFHDFYSNLINCSTSISLKGHRPIDLIDKCANISFTQKIGWKIPTVINRLNDKAYKKYSENKSYETVANHMYECYLIGLFYLPEVDIQNSEYNKQEVLNLLLIHDIGESLVDDYPPYYEKIDEKKKQEDAANRRIFLGGLHEGVSDLTYQLTLWDHWRNEDNINAKIAKDIDKIQMIYKMFVLLSKTDIYLSRNRIISILKDKERIRTDYGKHIYKILIEQNDTIDAKYRYYI